MVIAHADGLRVHLGIWLVEKFTYLLWGRELPLLFGWFPLQYIFHAADAGVLAVFLFMASAMLGVALVIGLFGPRTNGRMLEQISH